MEKLIGGETINQEELLETYRKWAEAKPNNIIAKLTLSHQLSKMGYLEESVKVFFEAERLNLQCNRAEYLYNTAYYYALIGHHGMALDYMMEFKRCEPHNKEKFKRLFDIIMALYDEKMVFMWREVEKILAEDE